MNSGILYHQKYVRFIENYSGLTTDSALKTFLIPKKGLFSIDSFTPGVRIVNTEVSLWKKFIDENHASWTLGKVMKGILTEIHFIRKKQCRE